MGFSGGGNASDIEVADYDGDGDQDAFVVDTQSDIVSLLRNDGAGNLTKETIHTLISDVVTTATGDVDDDGDVDVFFVH